MYGAVLGDIVGSRFEFNNIKTKDFDFITKDSEFTDDTVMTLAIKKVIDEYAHVFWHTHMRVDMNSEDTLFTFKKKLVHSMKIFGLKYPFVGYGARFMNWLLKKDTDSPDEPYNSFGNGSAMRVSPVIIAAHSLKEAETLAKLTAEITHNHPEGIKGAQAIAGAGYLLRTGSSKEEVKKYIEKKYYKLNFTLEEIRDKYEFNETCQGSVPQAIVAFLESDSLEDAIRNAVSIGGDSDTIACMAGALGEAYYGITEEQKKMVDDKLPEDLKFIINFYIPHRYYTSLIEFENFKLNPKRHKPSLSDFLKD